MPTQSLDAPKLVIRWGALLFAALGSPACAGGSEDTSPSSHSGRTTSSTGAGSPGSSAPVSSAASSTSAPEAPPIPHAGAWSGSFEAKKAPVTLDPGVKDRAWSADDGKAASGPGTLSLQIGREGAVTGELAGALGAGTITGWVDGDRMTATFAPKSADSEPSMAGTLVLDAKDGAWTGSLRASSGDAVLVRAATVELKRQP